MFGVKYVHFEGGSSSNLSSIFLFVHCALVKTVAKTVKCKFMEFKI